MFASILYAKRGKQALLPDAEHDQLLGVMKDALSDSLSAQLDPRFQRLTTCINAALQQSVQVVSETSYCRRKHVSGETRGNAL